MGGEARFAAGGASAQWRENATTPYPFDIRGREGGGGRRRRPAPLAKVAGVSSRERRAPRSRLFRRARTSLPSRSLDFWSTSVDAFDAMLVIALSWSAGTGEGKRGRGSVAAHRARASEAKAARPGAMLPDEWGGIAGFGARTHQAHSARRGRRRSLLLGRGSGAVGVRHPPVCGEELTRGGRWRAVSGGHAARDLLLLL